ncbi:uncharacterized protein LOC133533265 [Cydia pomonella]|uniref:uncharacterized protein LOC133533265 n=1 Tax=Cydia pomonella TaxID=82600 RepID=UPI002ADE4C86|nr:uncharacterized protein LOC133533265 [Cydia pomonella]
MPRLAPFTCCLIIVFTTFIDEGNGKWKSKNRENLQKDIAKFQEMAEKIEDEIEDIYDEYSDNWVKNEEYSNEEETLEMSDIDNAHNTYNDKNNINILNLISNYTKDLTEGKDRPVPESTSKANGTPTIDTIKISTTEKANLVRSKWPKFEDILLDMGKKYDWKNDRWIKVKKKADQSSEEKHIAFHERHFSYKTVKLNRSKSRRNVVIAVTAVR